MLSTPSPTPRPSALSGTSGQHASRQAQQQVRWLDPEWRQIVSAIYCEQPDVFATESATALKARHVFEAQDCLQQEHRRPLISIAQNFDITRAKLVDLYRELCAEGRIVAQGALFPESDKRVAGAAEQGKPNAVSPASAHPPVKWTPQEWQAVAVNLYRGDPRIREIRDPERISADAVMLAQSTLDDSRRRSIEDIQASISADRSVLEAVFDVLRKSDPDSGVSVERRQLRRVCIPGSSHDQLRSALDQDIAARYGSHYRLAPSRANSPAAPAADVAETATPAEHPTRAAEAPRVCADAQSRAEEKAAPPQGVQSALPPATPLAEPTPAQAMLAQIAGAAVAAEAPAPQPMRPFVRMVCEELMRAAMPYLRPYLEQHLAVAPHPHQDK